MLSSNVQVHGFCLVVEFISHYVHLSKLFLYFLFYLHDLLRIVHIADFDTPIVNLHGDHLFSSWRALLNDGQRSKAPLYTFSRKNVLTNEIWAGEYCDGWRKNHSITIRIFFKYNITKFYTLKNV
uniref:Endostatin domain-containing protein n=1 Tax=Heterorhabditis bacteriophora TaxID=37862 RepID=A0A1I7WHD1_HETBA